MSPCPVTPELLARLAAGAASPAETARLREHWDGPCEACKGWLTEAGPALLLEAAAGGRARLTASESEAVFDAALRASGVAVRPSPTYRRAWLLAPALASLALAFVMVRGVGAHDDSMRVKGSAAAPAIGLEVYLGRVGPEGPRIQRQVSPGEQVDRQARLLFRYRITAPAPVFLLAAEPGSPPQLLWSTQDGVAEAGGTEVQQHGQVLALSVDELGNQLVLAAVSAPPGTQPPWHLLERLDPVALASVCPGCTLDIVQLEVQP